MYRLHNWLTVKFDFEALDGQREFDMKDPEEMKNRLDVVNLSFAAE
jgi:tRNA 2-thiocytidine biosynthesis protein TtcA